MIVFELLSCLLNLGQFLVPYPPFSVYGFCLTLFGSMTCTFTPFFLQVITILLKRDNSMMDTKNQKNYKESKSFTPFLMDAGSDAILLGAETLRGLYPVETISIVGKICSEVCLFLKLLIFLNVSFKLAN